MPTVSDKKGKSLKKTSGKSTKQKRRKSVCVIVDSTKGDGIIGSTTRRSSEPLPPLKVESPLKHEETLTDASTCTATRKLTKMPSSMFKDKCYNDDNMGCVTREVEETQLEKDCDNTVSDEISPQQLSSLADSSQNEEPMSQGQVVNGGSEKPLFRHLSTSEKNGNEPSEGNKNNETFSKRLLRKLSSFTTVTAEKGLEKSENADTEHKKENSSPFLSRLQKSFKFIGNPTSSFAEEEGLEVQEQENSSFTRPTVKSAIVKYFQKNTILKEKQVLTIEKPDEEEASIRQILHEQEQAEENETIERIVFSNKRAQTRRMSADWRKVQMAVETIGHLKKPVDKNVSSRTQTDSTRSTSHSIYDCDSDSSSEDARDNAKTSESPEDILEFANAFFD